MSQSLPIFNGVASLGSLQSTSAFGTESVPTVMLNAGSQPYSAFATGNLVLTDSSSNVFGPIIPTLGTFFNATQNGLLINRQWTPAQSMTALTLTAAAAATPISLSLTSVTGTIGNTYNGYAVYTGTITGGASDGLVGYTFTVTGFTNGGNNGTFYCIASTATTLTMYNAAAIAETHAATAASGTTVYTGTIPAGGTASYAGAPIIIAGFTNGANNGTFYCVASTGTTLTLLNSAGVAESHAATAQINTNANYSGASINVNVAPVGNPNLDDSCYVSGLSVNMVTSQQVTIPGTSSGVGITAIETENSVGLPSGNTSTVMIYELVGLYTESLIGNFANPDGVYNISNHWNYHCAGMGYVGHATGTIGNSAGIFMEGPRVPTGCVVTQRSGIYMQPQNQNSGGTNSNAWGIYEASSTEANALGTINIGGASGPLISTGGATPEGAITSVEGGFFFRSNGLVYAKVSGSGNTGWSPINPGIRTATTTDAATNDDGTILCNGTFTETLPTTGIYPRKKFVIKNIGTGVITVSSTANIDGATSLSLTTQYQSVTVEWDGTQYWIE